MTAALHQAILDAIASPAYRERGILVNTLLEATHPLHMDRELLYRSIYTIFRAMPDRLVRGTTLDISTADLPDGGIEIHWEGKERIDPRAPPDSPLHEIMGHGPHGDLVEIALVALETYCNMHAGYLDATRERVASASAFDRPEHVIRRVFAVIPGRSQGDGPTARSVPSPAVDGPASGSRPRGIENDPVRERGGGNAGRLPASRPRRVVEAITGGRSTPTAPRRR